MAFGFLAIFLASMGVSQVTAPLPRHAWGRWACQQVRIIPGRLNRIMHAVIPAAMAHRPPRSRRVRTSNSESSERSIHLDPEIRNEKGVFMKIVLIGANGKIGELVQKALAGAGHEIVKVGRKSGD